MSIPGHGVAGLQAEAHYQRLIRTSPFCVFVVDADGMISELNPAGARILGRSPGHVLGRHFQKLVAASDMQVTQRAFQRLMAGEEPVLELEIDVLRPTGERRRVHVTASGIVEEDGTVSGVHGISRDVSAERQLQTRLQQAQKMEAVGRLAGGVAHDFNNILSVIGGTVELLSQEAPKGTPLRRELDEIRQAADRGSGLTQQLLAFSRQQVLEPVVLDLNRIVSHTGRILRRLLGEDIEVVQHLEPTLGPVRADPSQVEQILLNLAINARDAMPRGGSLILITRNGDITAAEAAQHSYPVEPGRYVTLTVTDTGQGMPREVLERVFEPFFTTKHKSEGTGLGLSTVYGIVKQSGGYIWVDSEPGGGTTFRIYLPRVEATQLSGGEVIPARDPVPVPTPPGSVLVLLVEDDAGVRRVARRMLERSGYQVLEAEDGPRALELAGERGAELDLLLTDVVMPRMSGPEVAARIRALQPRIKVLFTSGYTDAEMERHPESASEGAAFLQKPYTMETLAAKVAEVLVGGP